MKKSDENNDYAQFQYFMKLVSRAELGRSDGRQGARKWIAYRGTVFDVTDCPKWTAELHERLHFPGQDLSSSLIEAPHGPEVFDYPCVKLVGRLDKE